MASVATVLRRKLSHKPFHFQLLTVRSFSASEPQRIEKILIANRGEIACRIMRTAKRLGIQTVAVYSDADRHSLHVKSADEAVHIGPPPARLSYLKASSIIDAAIRTGAQAIHPGYGFLSESAEFAQLCEDKGLTFIGPPASAIRDMGDKSASKRIMGAAGGMRIVQSPDEFVESFLGAQREAAASFGVSTILLEKYITQPRHIEVQIFGDKHGKVLHLYERDCSVQRRHQKIIEEAPAPNVSNDFRTHLGQAAVSAAKAVGYHNAGTVEFIVDTVSGQFYFMEMNTRLQVEHPVTEMIVGQDLVEWQIRVASGEHLPISQSQVPLSVRVETGVEQGDTVSMHYDPMIAKLVVWGENRAAALVKLKDCLSKFQVAGLPTNINFLLKLANHRAFQNGDVETHFIEHFKDDLFVDPSNSLLVDKVLGAAKFSATLAAACLIEKENSLFRENLPGGDSIISIWYSSPPFRVHHCARHTVELEWENEYDSSGSKSLKLSTTYKPDGSYLIEDQTKHIDIWYGSHHHHFRQKTDLELSDEDETEHKPRFDKSSYPQGTVAAPMAGLVVKVVVKDGTKVEEGQPILVLEAMKMEHVVKAPSAGYVRGLHLAAGQQVSDGGILFSIKITCLCRRSDNSSRSLVFLNCFNKGQPHSEVAPEQS
ncbi:hypothetical protein ACE6H2_028489 [Prunus campanulata]